MSPETQEMVEHIEHASSPTMRLVNQFIRENAQFLGCDTLNHPTVLESLEQAEQTGQGIRFLQIVTGALVQTLLKEIEGGKNVAAYASRILERLRSEYPESLVRIISGFIWKQGDPKQFIGSLEASLIEGVSRGTITGVSADIVLSKIGGRATVL